MLPESSVRQLKKLRQETKGTDIGDLTGNDRLNAKVPNLQYIGNPVDRDIESYEEFTKKDSKLQTIAFKSKLVNKKINENMKSNIKTFEEFDFAEGEEREDLIKNSRYNQAIRNTYDDFDTEREDYLDDEIDEEDFADDNEDEFGELEFYEDELEDDDDDDTVTCPDCDGEGGECERCEGEGRVYRPQDIPPDIEYFNDDLDESVNESFTRWYAENRNSDILRGEYKEYVYSNPYGGKKSDKMTFRQWCKTKYKYSDEYEGGLEESVVSYKEKGSDVVRFSSGKDDDEAIDKAYRKTNNKVDKKSIKKKDPKNPVAESVKTFEAFSVPAAKKEESQPEYTMLGKEKEPKSNPNFGYAEVRAQEIKKITDFNVIDPVTPKERTIGGSAGVFIDNDTVKGYVNRIDGKDVYVESLDEPMVIKKFNIKDVVKTKKEK